MAKKQTISYAGIINMKALQARIKKANFLFWAKDEAGTHYIINNYWAVQVPALEVFNCYSDLLQIFQQIPEPSQSADIMTGLTWRKGSKADFSTMDVKRMLKVSCDYHVLKTGLKYSPADGGVLELFQIPGQKALVKVAEEYSAMAARAEGYTATTGRSPVLWADNEGMEKLIVCPVHYDSNILDTIAAAL